MPRYKFIQIYQASSLLAQFMGYQRLKLGQLLETYNCACEIRKLLTSLSSNRIAVYCDHMYCIHFQT